MDDRKELRRFYRDTAIFLVILLALVICLDYLSTQGSWGYLLAKYTDSWDYFTVNAGPEEVNPYIEKVRKQDDTTKLIIGDSVCCQLFNDLQKYNNDFSIAGTNGAVSMAGQYILAKEYLDNHPGATDVFLIVLPESFWQAFDTKWGYQYTVMPFVETDTLRYLDKDTIRIMESVYGSLFMSKDVVELIDDSPVNRKIYLNLLRQYSRGYDMPHFELADEYVTKIDEMCKSKNVSFHMYPGPVSDGKKDLCVEYNKEFVNSAIYSINPRFFEEIYYYPAEQAADGFHFSGEYANREHFNSVIREVIKDTELQKMLRLE